MSGFDKERELLEKLFKDNFSPASPYASTPIQYENVPFDEPASRIWVRISIVNGESVRRAIGINPLRRHSGAVFVQVFTPPKLGTKPGRLIADAVATALQDRSVVDGTNRVEMLDSSIKSLGIVENGCHQFTVATPFQRDD